MPKWYGELQPTTLHPDNRDRLSRPPITRGPGVSTAYVEQMRNRPSHSHTGEELCIFCAPKEDEVLSESEYFIHMTSGPRPIEWWDGREVTRHTLLVPRRHIEHLDDLTPKEALDWMQRTSKLGRLGVANYTRPANNPEKSLKHLHTHLFELGNRAVSRVAYDGTSGTTVLDFEDKPEA